MRPTPKSSAATKTPTRRGSSSSAPWRHHCLRCAAPPPHRLAPPSLFFPSNAIYFPPVPPTRPLLTAVHECLQSDFSYTRSAEGWPGLADGGWIWPTAQPHEAALPDPATGRCTWLPTGCIQSLGGRFWPHATGSDQRGLTVAVGYVVGGVQFFF